MNSLNSSVVGIDKNLQNPFLLYKHPLSLLSYRPFSFKNQHTASRALISKTHTTNHFDNAHSNLLHTPIPRRRIPILNSQSRSCQAQMSFIKDNNMPPVTLSASNHQPQDLDVFSTTSSSSKASHDLETTVYMHYNEGFVQHANGDWNCCRCDTTNARDIFYCTTCNHFSCNNCNEVEAHEGGEVE